MHIRCLLGIALAAGCSGGSKQPDAEVRCPVGDVSMPAQLEIVYLDASSNVHTAMPGDHVPLQAPPQGGWIMLLGARATNIDGCRVNLTTSFREPCSTSVLSVDRRPAQLDIGSDGWGVTSVTSFGNLATCPQATAQQDLHDSPFDVTVELDDADGKHAEATITVVPTCADTDPAGSCMCQCDHNYVLGGSCPPAGSAAPPLSCDAGV